MKEYPKGLYFNERRPNAPEFVIGGLSIKKFELLEWLDGKQASESGYINLDILQGKERPYIIVNEYVRQPGSHNNPKQPYSSKSSSTEQTEAPF